MKKDPPGSSEFLAAISLQLSSAAAGGSNFEPSPIKYPPPLPPEILQKIPSLLLTCHNIQTQIALFAELRDFNQAAGKHLDMIETLYDLVADNCKLEMERNQFTETETRCFLDYILIPPSIVYPHQNVPYFAFCNSIQANIASIAYFIIRKDPHNFLQTTLKLGKLYFNALRKRIA